MEKGIMDDDVPLLRVGIICNIKKDPTNEDEAEYDSPRTIEALKNALVEKNIEVKIFEVDENLIHKLRENPIDIAFNIAEGKNGRSREAQVPAILDMMNIPYTGSDATTLCLSLDKSLCKSILKLYGVLSPSSIIVKEHNYKKTDLVFPVIIKPNAEGSSKGISSVCVAKNEKELREIIENKIFEKSQLIIEEYIKGKEFTVGIIKNGAECHVLEPMEIVFKENAPGKDFSIYSYEIKQTFTKYVDYKCPSSLDTATKQKMIEVSKNIYEKLNCLDFARIDYRVDENNNIYFIEINPLPGLTPNYSDFPMIADFCGLGYNNLIRTILLSATKRYNMKVSY